MRVLPLLLLLAGVPVRAVAAPVNERALRTEGAFFALSVADLVASAAWYEQKLGLSVTLDIPKQNGIAVKVLEGGGLTVELIQDDQARPLAQAAPGVTDPQRIHGLYKAGFVVKDFDRALALLRERGVEIAFGPFPETATQRANVLIRDNSGNLLQVFGD
jgi:catechol 2,3-dioxygenase-like lactoylglutathione lyase family enzyme